MSLDGTRHRRNVRRVNDMLVQSILISKAGGVETVAPDLAIGDAAHKLATLRIGALVVVDDGGGIVGILSERDIVRGVGLQGDTCLRLRVADLMTSAVLTCTADDTVESIMKTMTERRIRHLPVLDGDGMLCGIVTIGDVVKSRLAQADMEVDNLRHYVVAAR